MPFWAPACVFSQVSCFCCAQIPKVSIKYAGRASFYILQYATLQESGEAVNLKQLSLAKMKKKKKEEEKLLNVSPTALSWNNQHKALTMADFSN